MYLAFCCASKLIFTPAIGWSQQTHHGNKPAVPAIGAPAVAFELKLLDGKPVNLATFRGNPLMVNFFASWCDPCRDEMPFINAVAARAGKDGYSVLGIAVDDLRAAVTEYAQEAKLAFPIALDLNNTVKRAYRIFGPPATYFIDAQGIVRDIVIGPMTPDRMREGLKKAGTGR
jgi:cytochrome c biogenesis protein CcmG/thiol:disulfide interchange protein DsbE